MKILATSMAYTLRPDEGLIHTSKKIPHYHHILATSLKFKLSFISRTNIMHIMPLKESIFFSYMSVIIISYLTYVVSIFLT
jgi:hypothetical protein